MARERLDISRSFELMALAMAANCEKTLDAGERFLPSLMLWYDGEELAHPGAVVVFEPPEAGGRPGDALRMARERLEMFTRGAAAWALAYEGLVTTDGGSSAAIMVETYLRRPPAAARLVRPYRPRSAGRPFAWTGEFSGLEP